jgi:hypothetical protein
MIAKADKDKQRDKGIQLKANATWYSVGRKMRDANRYATLAGSKAASDREVVTCRQMYLVVCKTLQRCDIERTR